MAHGHQEVVEGVFDLAVFGVDGYVELLVRAVVVDVGLRGGAQGYGRGVFRHHEAALQQRGVGVVLVVDAQEIVARYCWAHLLVGDGEGVVHIMHRGGSREVVGVDCAFVETVEKLTVDQPRGLPLRVAVHERVAEVLAVVGEAVEGYFQAVGAAEHNHRRGEVVAFEAHLQGVYMVVEDAGHGVGGILGTQPQSGDKEQEECGKLSHNHFIGLWPCCCNHALARLKCRLPKNPR